MKSEDTLKSNIKDKSREKAEILTFDHSKDLKLSTSVDDLIQELQIYQKKQETQNAELRGIPVELQESEELHRITLSNISDAIFITDDNGDFIYIGSNVNLIFGYSDSEVESFGNISKLLGERLFEFKELESSGEMRKIEREIKDKEGEAHSLLINVKSVSIKGGTLLYTCHDITERKKTFEEQLNFLQDLIDYIPSPIFYKNKNGLYQRCNRAFQEYVGFSKEKIINKTVHDVAPEEMAEKYHQMDRELFENPGVQVYEAPFRHADGTERYMVFNKATYIDSEGQVAGLMGIMLDITERKKSEKALKAEKDKLKTFTEKAPFGMVFIDKQGTYNYINPKFKEMFGYSLSDIPNGKEWFRMAYPDLEYRHKVISTWIDDFKDTKPGEKKPRIFKVTGKDGNEKIINFTPVLVKNGDYLMSVEDVTPHKKAEKALKESEKKFRQIAENIEEVFWIIDPKMNQIIYISPAYAKVWGRSCESLYREPKSWIESIHPEDQKKVINSIFGDFQEVKSGEGIEYRILRPNGSMRWIWARSFPVRDESGDISRVVGVAMDINQRKRAEAELQKLKDELEIKVAERTDELRIARDNLEFELYERQRIEEALVESEEKFRGLFNQANDMIFLIELTEDGRMERFIEINDTACQMLEYSRDELLNMNPASISIQKRADFPEIPSKFLDKGNITFEMLLISKNSLEIPVEVNCNLFTLKGKKFAISIARDITERRQAQEALKKEKDKAQMYIDIAEVILVVIEADQKVSLINKKGCEVLGYKEEDIIGKNWVENFIPERERDGVIDAFKELIAGKVDFSEYFENPVLTREGEERIVAWHNKVLKDDDGNIMGTLSSGEDITQRKQVEEALQKSEERYRSIIESTQSGVLSVDKERKIRYINRQMAEMFGYKVQEAMGEDLLNFAAHEEQEKLLKHLKLREQGVREVYEIRLVRKDGSDLWALISANPLFDVEKHYMGSVAIIMDISARKGAEKALMRTLIEKDKDLRLISSSMIKATNHLLESQHKAFSEHLSKWN
jgi:PAS domain S-box-containing protein